MLSNFWWPRNNDGTKLPTEVSDAISNPNSKQPSFDDWGNVVWDQPLTPYSIRRAEATNGFSGT